MNDHVKEASVRSIVRKWLKAFNEKDAKTLLGLYDPDAIYANDGATLMRGIDQISPWFVRAFEVMDGVMYFKEEVHIEEEKMALVVGKFYFEPATPSEPDNETGRVAIVFRRAADGQWRMLLDMDNRPPDCTREDFAERTSENAYLR